MHNKELKWINKFEMNVKNIILSSFVAGSGFIASSCERIPYREVPQKEISQSIIKRRDSIANETKKILKDSCYKKFANDTLELTQVFYKAPAIFVRNLNKSAERNTPKTRADHYTVMTPVYTGKSTTLVPRTHYKYEDNFIKQKAVINSDKIFTRTDETLYIPVEYYGIPNPKLKKSN